MIRLPVTLEQLPYYYELFAVWLVDGILYITFNFLNINILTEMKNDVVMCVWSGSRSLLIKNSELSCSGERAIYCDINGPVTGRGVDAPEKLH